MVWQLDSQVNVLTIFNSLGLQKATCLYMIHWIFCYAQLRNITRSIHSRKLRNMLDASAKNYVHHFTKVRIIARIENKNLVF